MSGPNPEFRQAVEEYFDALDLLEPDDVQGRRKLLGAFQVRWGGRLVPNPPFPGKVVEGGLLPTRRLGEG